MKPLHAIFCGLAEAIRERFPNVRIENKVYSDRDHYQMFIIKSWGNSITINLLPVGFQIYRTHKDEKLFLYEDYDSVDNTLNYLEELFKFKYEWEKK